MPLMFMAAIINRATITTNMATLKTTTAPHDDVTQMLSSAQCCDESFALH